MCQTLIVLCRNLINITKELEYLEMYLVVRGYLIANHL